MGIREAFKSKEYFNKLIQLDESGIDLFTSKLQEPGLPEQRIPELHWYIFKSRLRKLVSMYSRGDSIDDLTLQLDRVIHSLREHAMHVPKTDGEACVFTPAMREEYIQLLWLVSWAYLLNISESRFKELVGLINFSERDYLFDRIVSYRLPSKNPAQSLVHAKTYSPLMQVIQAGPQDQSRLLFDFIKKYYFSLKGVYWHDTHLSEDSGYFGYWFFELAAIVKGEGIDDLEFATHMFYPRDLTGKKLLKTWEDSQEGELARAEYARLKRGQ